MAQLGGGRIVLVKDLDVIVAVRILEQIDKNGAGVRHQERSFDNVHRVQ